MSSSLGVAVDAFLLDPHRSRQHAIGGHGCYGRICIRDHDEIVGVAVAWIGLVRTVRGGLQVVVDLYPVEIELAVMKHPVLLDRMIAGLLGNDAGGDAPDFLGLLAMLRVGDNHVRG